MMKIIVYIIKPVNAHRAPNVICLILCFSRSILVNFCVLLQTSSSEAQMLILKRNIFREYWLFCDTSVDSSCLHLTFVAFCHFVCHSLTIAKNNVTTTLTIQTIPDQILDRFYITSMEFLLLMHTVFHGKTSLVARNEERQLSLQANPTVS